MKTRITSATLLTLAYFWWMNVRRGILVDIHFKIVVILQAFSRFLDFHLIVVATAEFFSSLPLLLQSNLFGGGICQVRNQSLVFTQSCME